MHDFNMLLINNAEIAELMQMTFCVLCIEWKDIFSSNKCTITYFIIKTRNWEQQYHIKNSAKKLG